MAASARGKQVAAIAEEFQVGEAFLDIDESGDGKFILIHNVVTPSGILHDHTQAALFVYDEGLLGSDIQLANALWRRFFLSMHQVYTMT